MTATFLALSALMAAAPQAEPTLLTPGNVAEHGFHFQCFVVDEPDKVASIRESPLLRPKGPVVVRLRFGPVQQGPFAVSAADLQRIGGVCLVIRDGDAVQQSVPLSVEVDPGNVVHLYTHFSTQKHLLSTTQLVFDETGKDGTRTFVVNLEPFIQKN